MKKLVLMAMVALALAIVACSAPPTPTPKPLPTMPPASPTPIPTKAPPTATPMPTPTVAPLTLDALKNAEYQSEYPASRKAKLTDGTYKEKVTPNSPTELVIKLDQVAVGDLNGDGAPDAAVVLIAQPGGSGTFYDLAAVLNQNGTPKHVASALLGDRIKINSITVQAGEIVVDMVIQGPKDPMTKPTLAVTRKYKLQDGKLVATVTATPTAGAQPTKASAATTPKPVMTATPAKPPMPKGSIAYHWNDSGIDRLSILNVETGGVTPYVVVGPVMDVTMNTNAHIGEWSPDGSKFAYIFAGAPGASNILKVVDRSGNTASLYSSDTLGGLSSPTWSPDGLRIAFARTSSNQQNWSIVVINADGAKCGDYFECLNHRVAGEQYRGGLAWSKQGLFTLAFNSTGANDVYTMYSTGNGVTNLTNHPADDGSPAWSPDGKLIAFTSNRDGRAQIHVMNADGSGLHRVSQSAFNDFSPTWSPDGKWIAFASTREGQTSIYMMDLTGGNVTQLTKTSGDHPVWSR